MPWLSRGLADGVVTSRWPKAADPYESDSLSGIARARADLPSRSHTGIVEICPTGAIVDGDDGLEVEAAHCIGCARCVLAHPDLFEIAPGSGQARLVADGAEAPPERLASLRADIARRTARLQRSVHLRHVDAGSDGAEEWEINALFNPIYDVHRLGIFLTPSPRHADILLVTGIGATGMLAPLARTWEGMPEPKVVIAVGTDACSGGVWRGSHAGSDGVADAVPVDVWVPGSPPTPFAILRGILLALDRLPEVGR